MRSHNFTRYNYLLFGTLQASLLVNRFKLRNEFFFFLQKLVFRKRIKV